MCETNSTKKCSKCTYKPLSDFSKCVRNEDGLQYMCKECTRAYHRTDVGKASQAKYRVKYLQTDAAKISQKKSGAKYRKTDAGKISRNKNNARYRARNPIKTKAASQMNHALEFGKITRPSACSKCSSTERIEGHHDDYLLPMVVRWLCQNCHISWHKENGPGLNG